MRIKSLLLAGIVALHVGCGTNPSSNQNAEESQTATDKSGQVWLEGNLIAFFAAEQAKTIFTQMNADLAAGKVKMKLTADYGYANVGWQPPRIDIDSINMAFENNLLVTKLKLILPYKWKNLYMPREKQREFTVDIKTEQSFIVIGGVPSLKQTSQKASNLKGGEQAHRQQLNLYSEVANFFEINPTAQMESTMKSYVAENTPEQNLGLYNGHIENNNLVYD